ncbi:MAG: phage tail tube protein [Sphingomonadaceae bacterium]
MLYWKSKTLLAKIEGVYGSDSGPSAAANAILATNVQLRPMEGEDVQRNVEKPYFGASPSIPVGLHSVLTFDIELAGSGAAGTAPGWGPILRMCAIAETVTAATSVEYTPITDDPESGTIYMAIDSIRHVMLGTRGTASFSLNAQGIPTASITLTGLFTLPTTEAKIAPDLSAFQAPLVATKVNTPLFTIGGQAMRLRDFQFDLGNDVQRRFLQNYEGIHIVDRAESLKLQVEAVALATYNPFSAAILQASQVIAFEHGNAAGSKIRFDFPMARQQRLTGYENQQNIVEWPLNFVPLPDAGNDQWTITLT